jgi:hypothetical protein
MGRSRVYATSTYIANHNGRLVIPGSSPRAVCRCAQDLPPSARRAVQVQWAVGPCGGPRTVQAPRAEGCEPQPTSRARHHGADTAEAARL